MNGKPLLSVQSTAVYPRSTLCVEQQELHGAFIAHTYRRIQAGGEIAIMQLL